MTERRFATIAEDGWTLISAEARHAENPSTFWIPERQRREALGRGDGAKLLFDIETRESGQVVDRGVDRMWVLVTERNGDDYIGILESDPGMAENLSLRRGSEVLFRPEHVCEINRPPDGWLVQRFGDVADPV